LESVLDQVRQRLLSAFDHFHHPRWRSDILGGDESGEALPVGGIHAGAGNDLFDDRLRRVLEVTSKPVLDHVRLSRSQMPRVEMLMIRKAGAGLSAPQRDILVRDQQAIHPQLLTVVGPPLEVKTRDVVILDMDFVTPSARIVLSGWAKDQSGPLAGNTVPSLDHLQRL